MVVAEESLAGNAVTSSHHDDVSQKQLWREVLSPEPLDFHTLFHALASSNTFHKLWAERQSRAPFILPRLGFVERAISLADVAAGFATAAAAGEAVAAFQLVQVGPMEELYSSQTGARQEKICSKLPSIQSVAELLEVLRFGTVIMNFMCEYWRAPAVIARAASAAFGFRTAINAYITAPGFAVSTPVHNDGHDVLVLQVEGEKHWRVYRPLLHGPGKPHPFHRYFDDVREADLGKPVIDVTLRSGECLFVPTGFWHATSTLESVKDANTSMHLSLQISVVGSQRTYGELRKLLLAELKDVRPKDDKDLSDNTFWTLNLPVPYGCLMQRGPCDREQHLKQIAQHTLQLLFQIDLADLPCSAEDRSKLSRAAMGIIERWAHNQERLQEEDDKLRAQVIEHAAGEILATHLRDKAGAFLLHGERAQRRTKSIKRKVTPSNELIVSGISARKYCDMLEASPNNLYDTLNLCETEFKFPDEVSQSSREAEAYEWEQTSDDIEVTFKTKRIQKGDAKLVKVKLLRMDIKVEFKNETLLQGRLLHAIDPECSTWTLSDGIVQITLVKRKSGEVWAKLWQDSVGRRLASADLIDSDEYIAPVETLPKDANRGNHVVDRKLDVTDGFATCLGKQAATNEKGMPPSGLATDNEELGGLQEQVFLHSKAYVGSAYVSLASERPCPLLPCSSQFTPLVVELCGHRYSYYSIVFCALVALMLAAVGIKKAYTVQKPGQDLQTHLMLNFA